MVDEELDDINLKFFTKDTIVHMLLGAILLVAGLSCMWWGAYSSCTDGGGRLRGIVPYYQCVLNESNDVVPYMDQVSIKDVPRLCDKTNGGLLVNVTATGYIDVARRDLNTAVHSTDHNVTIFGQNITITSPIIT